MSYLLVIATLLSFLVLWSRHTVGCATCAQLDPVSDHTTITSGRLDHAKFGPVGDHTYGPLAHAPAPNRKLSLCENAHKLDPHR